MKKRKQMGYPRRPLPGYTVFCTPRSAARLLRGYWHSCARQAFDAPEVGRIDGVRIIDEYASVRPEAWEMLNGSRIEWAAPSRSPAGQEFSVPNDVTALWWHAEHGREANDIAGLEWMDGIHEATP